VSFLSDYINIFVAYFKWMKTGTAKPASCRVQPCATPVT
jgi:hypothetical protein